jgi:hypothetical protein
MRKFSWLLLLALLALPAAQVPADAKGGGACPHFTRNYARLADLPRGAAAALGFPIAERGAPWNATDDVGPGPLLPFARFISAQGGGCALTIRYERGGIAHSFETATLALRAGRWILQPRR